MNLAVTAVTWFEAYHPTFLWHRYLHGLFLFKDLLKFLIDYSQLWIVNKISCKNRDSVVRKLIDCAN